MCYLSPLRGLQRSGGVRGRHVFMRPNQRVYSESKELGHPRIVIPVVHQQGYSIAPENLTVKATQLVFPLSKNRVFFYPLHDSFVPDNCVVVMSSWKTGCDSKGTTSVVYRHLVDDCREPLLSREYLG